MIAIYTSIGYSDDLHKIPAVPLDGEGKSTDDYTFTYLVDGPNAGKTQVESSQGGLDAFALLSESIP